MIVCSRSECQTTAGCKCRSPIPDLPADFGKIGGKYHPDTVIANAALLAERERCALIVEQSAGFPTHKLRRKVAMAIRDPATFYVRR